MKSAMEYQFETVVAMIHMMSQTGERAATTQASYYRVCYLPRYYPYVGAIETLDTAIQEPEPTCEDI